MSLRVLILIIFAMAILSAIGEGCGCIDPPYSKRQLREQERKLMEQRILREVFEEVR